MDEELFGPLTLHTEVERWPLANPFQITGRIFEFVDVLVVILGKEGCCGYGEAAGVFYKGDDAVVMARQVESMRVRIEGGLSRDLVQKMLPPGGVRNALDCALWDLEAKLRHCLTWEIAGLQAPHPLLTTFTCGANIPEKMAEVARGYKSARAIKLKLTGEPIDAERVRAVREALPDVWLGVDANQGFTRDFLERLMPTLVEARVALIEQPLPVGQESLLEGFQSPIPLAADESAQSLGDLPTLVGRFSVVNIKLDKCGGLTEGLAMARASSALGLDAMVGNMLGTSLAMAPAFLVGQLCKVVDLDGPVFLKRDRAATILYRDGLVDCPTDVWGNPA